MEQNFVNCQYPFMENIRLITASAMKANEGFENENVRNETNLEITTFLHEKIFNFLSNKGIA